MAIDLATGFNIGSKDAIDERQVLTLEQMKNLDESIYPDKYFAICKDNGKLYIYDASNDVSETSGKFRVLEGNVIGDSTVVDGARYYTLEEVDLSYHFLLAKINFGDKTSFSGKMTFMFNHASTFKIASIPFTEKKEFFFNHKEGKDFSYVMHAYPIINPAVSNAAQPVLFNDFNFRGILTENNEFYLFLRGMLDTDNYIHNFYIEYIGDGTIEETFVFDDGSTNPYSSYGWSATKWYKEEGISDSDLIQPGCITLANSGDVVSNSIASKVYGSLRGLGCYDSSVALTVPMYKLYPSQALFCDVTEFSNYQTLFPYEEEADAESRVYILCIARETNYYLRWERKDGTKQAICYNNDRLGQPIVWNMIVGDGGSTEGASTYTTLTQLQLTADATVEDVVDALKNGESFLAPVNTFTNYETIFPNKVPSDQWNKIHIIKGTSLPNSHIRCYSQSGACEYLANVNNTNIVGWNDVSGTYIDISDSIIEKLGTEILKYPVGKYRINSNATGNKFTDLPSNAESKSGLIEVNGTAVGKSPFTDTWVYRMYKFECLSGTTSYVRRLDSGATAGQIEHDTGWCKEGQEIYTSLSQLGLDTTATINDIVGAMKDGTVFIYKTDVFDYATEYNNIQYGTVTIDKQSAGRVQVLMTDKNTGNLYVGRMDTNNLFVGWRSCTFHRVVAQATAGYFKFKPTSDGGFEQPLRISATDNYGGMIEISGNAPTQTQYKPFKCVRLSHGTYTDYNASNPANNKMEKLFFLDGYMYLKIASYTTVTFTGLVGAPTFVETIDTTTAVEIPIVSVITPQFDAYGDPYIISIGDSVSGDGSIQTLASLGLSTDIMTWKTGIYKVSHVSGLTGLPSDIINTSPGFRLEHHNIKKWMSGHAPYKDTWGQRHSIIYCDNGSVYHRFYESGATAGTYIKDTGWQQLITENSKTTDPYSCTGYTALTGTEDLFTLPCGHYASAKVDTAYNYPITDSSNVTAHIYVLGCLNEPANNKGYRIILYFDNKGRMYSINEWWGSFSNGWKKIGGNDIAKTTLTVKIETLGEGANFYFVKNGVCYVNYFFSSKNAESSGTVIFENLPKPAETMNVTLGAGTTWAEVRANSTNLYITGAMGANSSYVGNFSYPVAD